MEIIIILLLIILVIVVQKNYSPKNHSSKEHNYSNNGFANIDAKYTEPVVYDNFITKEEADHIISSAKNSFKESKIIGGFDTNIRKSKTTWLYTSDPVIYNIIKKVCDIGGYPMENAEPMQVVQYEPGGFYKDHHDSCCDDDEKCTEFVQRGGQRVMTMLIYLNDDFTGGSTKFSTIEKEIKPSKYGAIMFRPLEDNSNKCHPFALHKGTPVISGIKYVCNIWIREGKYN
jgi:prolyl 4-hydroxylase